MDSEFWIMLLKIVLFLPPILFLIYASLKYGGGKLQNIQSGKFIKILEKAVISKENSLLVVKIGEKGFVVSSTSSKIEILLELSDEELDLVSKQKIIPQYNSLKDLLKKVNKKKEEDNE